MPKSIQYKVVVCAFLSLILYSNTVFAQTAQQRAQTQSQNIIQDFEQEERFEEQQRLIEQEKKTLGTDLKYQKSEMPRQEACVDVKNIKIDGVTLVSNKAMLKNLKPFMKRCLYMADINEITQTINQLYIDKGYITSRSYLPAQDLSSGVLTIKVIEGAVEDIKSNSNLKRQELQLAFPSLRGAAFNLRDIEQGLDQINRLQSNKAKMNLEPGTNAGGSVVTITNEYTKPWQVTAGIDNSGSQSTGVLQGTLSASYDNFLGINDYAFLSIKHDLDRARRKHSRNISARYEVPYGYWNFHYALSYFDYVSEVSALTQDFKTNGSTRNHDFGFTRVVHRDANGKTSINGGLEVKDAINQLAGSTLESSSQKLSIGNLGVSHSRKISNGFIFGSLGYSRGLEWLGAHEDTFSSNQFAKGQFDRLVADLSLTKLINFRLNQYNPLFEGRAQWQMSPDTLFSSEQISIGGPFTVRGFKKQSISGDRGAYLVTNFSVPLPQTADEYFNNMFGTIRPFVGVDVGAITSDSKNTFEGGRISSASIGFKNQGGKLDFEFTYSKPLSAPSYVNKESEEAFFRVSIKF